MRCLSPALLLATTVHGETLADAIALAYRDKGRSKPPELAG